MRGFRAVLLFLMGVVLILILIELQPETESIPTPTLAPSQTPQIASPPAAESPTLITIVTPVPTQVITTPLPTVTGDTIAATATSIIEQATLMMVGPTYGYRQTEFPIP